MGRFETTHHPSIEASAIGDAPAALFRLRHDFLLLFDGIIRPAGDLIQGAETTLTEPGIGIHDANTDAGGKGLPRLGRHGSQYFAVSAWDTLDPEGRPRTSEI